MPAETTQVTPAATEAQIALCQLSPLALPQAPSSAPVPVTLMFATRMPSAAAFAVTQLMPQRIWESVPVPLLASTLTA